MSGVCSENMERIFDLPIRNRNDSDRNSVSESVS
jgi:hypothetical protein